VILVGAVISSVAIDSSDNEGKLNKIFNFFLNRTDSQATLAFDLPKMEFT